METSKWNNVVFQYILNYRPCIQISLQVNKNMANLDLMSTQNDNTSFWSRNSFRDLIRIMKTMTISTCTISFLQLNSNKMWRLKWWMLIIMWVRLTAQFLIRFPDSIRGVSYSIFNWYFCSAVSSINRISSITIFW